MAPMWSLIPLRGAELTESQFSDVPKTPLGRRPSSWPGIKVPGALVIGLDQEHERVLVNR